MNVSNLESARITRPGVLFKRTALKKRLSVAGPAAVKPVDAAQADSHGKHRIAFAGIFLFTLLMYSRPHEIMPGLFGILPLPKIVAIISILGYIGSRLRAGDPLVIWTIEMKMMALLWTLGLLLAPGAASPRDSFNVLFDPLIKILIVFAMQIALVDTRSRYRSMIGIMVFCQALYSISSIHTYFSGGYSEMASFHARISGWGKLLNNPNDVACVLAMLAPLSIIYALLQRGWKRWILFASVGVAAVAILLTFSRSGFLALIATCGLLIWKATRGRRIRTLLPVAVLAAVLSFALPGKYVTRLSTILSPETDTTNSAQERQQQMIRAAEVAFTRPILGVGMGNFHIYAINEMRAHNAYLETAAELGVLGLIVLLVIIFAPLRSLRRIERETAADGLRPDPEKHLVSACLQASFVAFIIYGFFGSIQYDSYLYSLVAFAVTFRRIYETEIHSAASNTSSAALGSKALTRVTRGYYRRPRELRGAK